MAVLGILFSWACAGPRYFDLHSDDRGEPGSAGIDKVLSIEDVEINPTYQDYRIVCRDSPFRVKYHNSASWSKSPDELIEDAVILFWKRRAVFKRVNSYGREDDPDLTMRTRVEAIEKCLAQKKWCGRLAVEVEIADAKNGKTLLLHSFDRKMSLPGGKTASLPETIIKILHEELAGIEKKLQRAI